MVRTSTLPTCEVAYSPQAGAYEVSTEPHGGPLWVLGFGVWVLGFKISGLGLGLSVCRICIGFASGGFWRFCRVLLLAFAFFGVGRGGLSWAGLAGLAGLGLGWEQIWGLNLFEFRVQGNVRFRCLRFRAGLRFRVKI